jgi:hypothetical protein
VQQSRRMSMYSLHRCNMYLTTFCLFQCRRIRPTPAYDQRLFPPHTLHHRLRRSQRLRRHHQRLQRVHSTARMECRWGRRNAHADPDLQHVLLGGDGGCEPGGDEGRDQLLCRWGRQSVMAMERGWNGPMGGDRQVPRSDQR